MEPIAGFESRHVSHSQSDNDDDDDYGDRCLVCNDLVLRPGPSGGFISQIEYLQLKASAERCMYCSILLEGLANLVPDVERVKRVMALRSEHDTELFSLHYIFNENDNFAWNCLHFYVDSSASPLVETFKPGRDLVIRTDSTDCLEEMERWVSTCNLSHNDCNGRDPYLPSRVLDVLRDEDHVFLCNGCDFDAEQEYYCTLSHCWGGVVPIRTMTSTIENFREGIAMTSLPKTFREAVLVTRRLKCRFLWIDSLCIIQDSVEDWKTESIRMGEVYGNAYVTIAATDAYNSSDGLFYHHKQSEVKHTVERKLENGISAQVHVRPAINHVPYFDNSVKPGTNAPVIPLLERCWCFQEYLLTPRVISFTKWELMWECRHTVTCHCNTSITNDQSRPDMAASNLKAIFHSDINSLDQGELRRLWQRIHSVYSPKRITFDKDKLPAISSIAKRFLGRGFGRYICGLWEETLISDMFWRRQPFENDSDATWAVTRTACSLVPSWSPMSVKDPTEFEYAPDTGGISIVEIKFVKSNLSDSESLTEAAARELLIRARLTEAVASTSSYPESGVAGLIDKSLEADTSRILWTPDVISERSSNDNGRFKQVFIMWGLGSVLLAAASAETRRESDSSGAISVPIGDSSHDRISLSASGIVLEKVEDAHERGVVTYRRLGICGFPQVYKGSGWERLAHVEPALFRII